MKFGAHISGGGTLQGTFDKAQTMGVDCLQMFATPPSNWNKAKRTEEDMANFRQLLADANIGPNFFHAIYLLNFGSENTELWHKSIDSLSHYLTLAPQMGIMGAIFHTGSHKGNGFDSALGRVAEAFNSILAQTPKESHLIIENNAGQGNLIARDAEEIARMIDGVKEKDRVSVCIDTCHAFANGTDWRLPEAVDAFVADFDKTVGWEKIVAIHVNDSKFDIGQNKDRHENIGEGYIGEKGFRNILHHEKFQNLPFILEVPGFENKGPDAKNLERLREYAG